MSERVLSNSTTRRLFSTHGWIGIILVLVFWGINWNLEGVRTSWAFFPLWLGYSLTVDALAFRINGTSLLTRDWRKYIGLFLVSGPSWWIFEVLNWRIRNWHYLGRDLFSDWQYFLFASLSFSVVMPAVFGTAELVSRAGWIRRMKPGLVVRPDKVTIGIVFALGWVFLGLLMVWPRHFFPLVWLSVFCILEPINFWLGNITVTRWTKSGDWRPVISLFVGVMITGFFWEMWNYFSFPKWVYTVPGVDFLHVFEMPILGYGGYLPFSLELYALYHLTTGFLGQRMGDYLNLEARE
ncbi:MAG TPA: hypothetical protein VMT46_10615 [Anaerolineaceae bacterium]|nr:hypothetical protein [Anaerolineaceae bacterium]